LQDEVQVVDVDAAVFEFYAGQLVTVTNGKQGERLRHSKPSQMKNIQQASKLGATSLRDIGLLT
jgi:hypothetical protein